MFVSIGSVSSFAISEKKKFKKWVQSIYRKDTKQFAMVLLTFLHAENNKLKGQGHPKMKKRCLFKNVITPILILTLSCERLDLNTNIKITALRLNCRAWAFSAKTFNLSIPLINQIERKNYTSNLYFLSAQLEKRS